MYKESVFSFKRPSNSPGFLLWQTSTVWQRLIKQGLEEKEITHPQFVILALLCWFKENGKTATQMMLADRSKLDKMTVSKSLKKLIANKLVSRAECKEDSRAKVVSLTTEGENLVNQLMPIIEGIDHQFFALFSEDEQKEYLRLLSKLLGC